MKIILIKSPRYTKKFRVIFENNKHVDFGAYGYSDYTIHQNKDRMHRYLKRHKKREIWTKNGIYSAGFWSRWLLWSKPSIENAISLIEKKFNVNIKRIT